MPKIFLYGLSLVLLFNNAYTRNTMQYIPNNKQQFFDPIQGKQMPKEMNTMNTPQEINAINPSQKMNIINQLPQNMGLQQKLPTPRNQQQVINQLVMNNQINQQPIDMQKELVDKTAQQSSTQSINNSKKKEKHSNNTKRYDNLTMEKAISLLLEKVDKIAKEQAKVNAQVKKHQAENNKKVKQALTDFYNANARALTLQDGTVKIVASDDIDPNILCKYSSEKPPKNTSTMVDTNIIYPAHYFPKDSSQKQNMLPQYLTNNQNLQYEPQQQSNMQQYLQHEQAAPRYTTQNQNSLIEVQQKQNFQQDFSQTRNLKTDFQQQQNWLQEEVYQR